jgi:hypothetical protein
MQINLSSIQNLQVRTFYALYWPQHQIIIDFFNRLPEEQFDFRMVDAPARKAETPRESLAHIIYVNLMDVLFFLRDHDILHVGWNLAYMDHLNLPQFDSLIQYWG